MMLLSSLVLVWRIPIATTVVSMMITQWWCAWYYNYYYGYYRDSSPFLFFAWLHMWLPNILNGIAFYVMTWHSPPQDSLRLRLRPFAVTCRNMADDDATAATCFRVHSLGLRQRSIS
eukprot:scaffold546_cov163-Amphora_coffeaeformis.AAC.1